MMMSMMDENIEMMRNMAMDDGIEIVSALARSPLSEPGSGLDLKSTVACGSVQTAREGIRAVHFINKLAVSWPSVRTGADCP